MLHSSPLGELLVDLCTIHWVKRHFITLNILVCVAWLLHACTGIQNECLSSKRVVALQHACFSKVSLTWPKALNSKYQTDL